MPPLSPALMIFWFAAHGRMTAPGAVLIDPMPLAEKWLSVLKRPPTMSREPSGLRAMPCTFLSSADGAHVVTSEPSVRLKAARRVRVAPPAVLKLPPAYTVEAETAIAATCPFTEGLKSGTSAPVVASIAARWPRACPSTEVKSPPM